MLLALSSAVLSTPTTSKPTRKERRTVRIGDLLQRTRIVPGRPMTWIDVTTLDNETDITQATAMCRNSPSPECAYRVIGKRHGVAYVVAGISIGKTA